MAQIEVEDGVELLTFENGVALTPKAKRTDGIKSQLATLKVGQSFVVSSEQRAQTCSNLIRSLFGVGAAAYRKVSNGFRVWRVK